MIILLSRGVRGLHCGVFGEHHPNCRSRFSSVYLYRARRDQSLICRHDHLEL